MKKPLRLLPVLLLAGLSLFSSGCARFSTRQTDLSYENGKPARAVTTTAKATTLFSSKSALANFKASQTDKTQSANVGTLSQESADTSTNIATNVRAVVDLLRELKGP
jgi:hypothetical protein